MKEAYEFHERYKIPEWDRFYISIPKLVNIMKPLEKKYLEHLHKSRSTQMRNSTRETIMEKRHADSLVKSTNVYVSEFKELQDISISLNNIEPLIEEEVEVEEKQNQEDKQVININYSFDDKFEVRKDIKLIEKEIIKEMYKVMYFCLENFEHISEIIENSTLQLKFIKQFNNSNENETTDFYNYSKEKDQIDLVLKETFREINFMAQYMDANYNLEKIVLQYFQIYMQSVISIEETNQIMSNIDKFSIRDVLKLNTCFNLKHTIKKEYVKYIHDKNDSEKNVKILETYSSDIRINGINFFMFGMFFGFLVLITLVCYSISSFFELDIDDDREFSRIFPCFRGQLVIAVFMWGNSLNIYLFKKLRINYRQVLKFSSHYSTFVTVMTRSAIFTTVTMFGILYYLLLRTKIIKMFEFINWIPKTYSPLIGWFLILGYLLCPFPQLMNYKGRNWAYRLLIESINEFKPEIPNIMFLGNLCSMSSVIRDFLYTICYYINFDRLNEDNWGCQPNSTFINIVSLFPPQILMMCVVMKFSRDVYDTYYQIINLLRFVFTYITITLSYFVKYNNNIRLYWIIASAWTNLFAFYWDLKINYGFLRSGSKNWFLRDKLAIKSVWKYYFFLFLDFLLRFLWILTISPDIVFMFIRPEFLLLVFYILEVGRRGIWNYMMVENIHISTCNTFRATQFIPLPLKWDDKLKLFKLKTKFERKPQGEMDKLDIRLNKIFVDISKKESKFDPNEIISKIKIIEEKIHKL